MNKSIKRIISLVLCLCMLSSMPIISFAAVDKVATIKVTSFSDTNVSIEWGKVSGADGYEIERLKSGDEKWKSLKKQEGLTYSDSVSPGTYYSYRVRAYKNKFLSKEYGAYSETVNVATKPKNVTGLKASAPSSKAIELTWSASEGAQNYVVYMYNAGTKEYEKVGTTDKTSYKVTGLSASTKYYFQVRAYHKLNGTITSDWTKVSATTPLGDVENFRLKECTDTTYALSWSKTKDAEGYEIYKYDVKTGEWDFFRTTKARSYKFKGVSKDYNVLYKIRAYKTTDGKKTYGLFSDAIAAGTIPSAPTNIVAARNTTNDIAVAWLEINGVEGYEVYRSDSALVDNWKKVGTTTEANLTDTTVPGTGTYKYRIRAYKGEGDHLFYSEFSDVKTINFQKHVNQDSIYTEELQQIGLIGYLYDSQNECFYTANDPWQRNFGYSEVYDVSAGLTLMIIETLRIKFPYKDKDWMIQVWKGQYGLVLIGAEVGVYNKPKDRKVEHYDCAEDADRLRMEMEMERLETVNGKQQWKRIIYRPYAEYWWITGFVFGNELGNMDSLRVNIRITMKDYQMLSGVTSSLESQGYYYEVDGLDVYFTFRGEAK